MTEYVTNSRGGLIYTKIKNGSFRFDGETYYPIYSFPDYLVYFSTLKVYYKHSFIAKDYWKQTIVLCRDRLQGIIKDVSSICTEKPREDDLSTIEDKVIPYVDTLENSYISPIAIHNGTSNIIGRDMPGDVALASWITEDFYLTNVLRVV